MAEKLFYIFFPFLIILSLFGAGFPILKFLSYKFDSIFEKFLFSVGLGYLVVTNILLFLGFYNFVDFYSCIFILIISLSMCFYYLFKFFNKTRTYSFKITSMGMQENLIISYILVLFILNFLGALAPPTIGDSMNHHLSGPKYFGKVGGFPFIPIVPWPAPGLMHVLYTQIILLSDGIPCQVLSCMFGLLTTLAIFLLTYNFLGRFFALISSALFYSLPLIVDLSPGGMVELGAFYCAILSLWSIIKYFHNFNIKWIILGGLLGGCAGATKLWSLAIGPASIFAIFFILKNQLFKNPMYVIKTIIVYSFMFNVILVPWFLRNFIASGNPIWPIASTFFETLYISDIWVAKYNSWQRGPGISLQNFILGPWNLTNNIDLFNAGYGVFTSYLLNPVYLIFSPVPILFRKYYSKNIRLVVEFLAIFCLVIYIIWFFGGYHQPRYLGVIYPFISILSGLGIKTIIDQYKNNFRIVVFSFLTLILSFFFLIAVLINQKYFNVAFGNVSKEQYLENNLTNYEGVRWINENLPENSKVLYVGTSAWYYMEKDYIPLALRSIDYDKIKNPKELYSIFKNLNLTHVYIESDDLKNAKLADWRKNELTDFKFDNVNQCQEWLNLGANGTGIYITTYHEIRPFVLMRGLELLGDLSLLALVKTKNIKSRTKRESVNSEAAVYQIK
ncbi:MAG: hypothetical protein CMG55_03465 [Candidatus Marinimicrobia bacterium]|nr:hypothetical protein [Candidatus Neomarinimicrobiota bacterium]|tara:strand:- start:4 stop:2025 length:2022 start_codon:yes stop_codon:yes gene_type:complete